ncbi:hypothetical protein [Cryptosporangium sp. NPDC051539]|uniref:hypothetical protein n=1 Tax=Cryptosporangium sp. NPDC051539 TaxID=3363962 RepID=UPI0037A7CBDD
MVEPNVSLRTDAHPYLLPILVAIVVALALTAVVVAVVVQQGGAPASTTDVVSQGTWKIWL